MKRKRGLELDIDTCALRGAQRETVRSVLCDHTRVYPSELQLRSLSVYHHHVSKVVHNICCFNVSL